MHEARFPYTGSLLESFGDALMNAFSKIQKPDQRFLDMKDYVDKFEDNLKHIEKLYSRISSRQEGTILHDFLKDCRSLTPLRRRSRTGLQEFCMECS